MTEAYISVRRLVQEKLIEVVKCALDDEFGINDATYEALLTIAAELRVPRVIEMLRDADGTDGRYYLPEASSARNLTRIVKLWGINL